MSWGDNPAPNIRAADTLGNTYLVAVNDFDSGNRQGLATLYAFNIRAGANTVTVTFGTTGGYRRVIVSEYSGIAMTAPLDVTAKSQGTSTTAANGATSTAATTTANGNLIFGVTMDDSGNFATINAGTGFTRRASLNGMDIATEDSIQATAGSVAATFTFSRADRYLAQMAAFKAASTGGGGSPVVSSLVCNPTSLNPGGSTTCTVTLSQPAPSGGSSVTLGSNNTTALPVPASVTVPATATSTTFTATAGTVTTSQTVTLTATLGGSTTATVTVTPPSPAVSSLVCNPTSLNPGGSTTCTVTLTQPAPGGGSSVALGSNNTTALPVPASVTVPQTTTSTTFTATAGTVTTSQTVTLTATLGGSTTATVTVTPSGGGSDTTPPIVAITSPTTATTFATNTTPLTLAGTGSDNTAVTQVTWSNSRGGSGTATGTTSWSVSSIALQPGTNVLTVTARDAAGNTATATLTVTYTAPDTTGPAAAITSHTNNQAVNISPITVAGTASDAGLGNSGISSVTVNGTAASGGTATGSGTANWSQALTLSPGSNTITVVAKDNSPAQNATTVQITVVYDSTQPTVAITSPTTAPTFTAATSPITLGGTASDTIGVTQVTWSNSQGGSGTASGTTSWSASGIALQAGTNVLTVTARDAAGNTATATLTVAYTPPSGLVAAYAFNEGAGTTSADVSGNGFTATLVSSPSWVAGQFGSALSFNGTSSYAATGLTTNLPNWTVSGWVYSPAAPTSAAPSGPIHREANYQINWNHGTSAFQGAVGVRVSGSWYAASFGALAANTWYNLAATYDGETLNAYTNGVLITSNTAPSGPADADPNALTIGRHAAVSQFFQGIVDNVRIYNRALSQTEIQSDMNTPIGGTASSDTTPPTVAITSPTTGATVSGTISVTATASDNVGVVGVRVLVDGGPLGAEVTTPPYSVSWNTVSATDGSHALSAVARDAAGNQTTSVISVTVSNGGSSGGGPSVSGQWSAPFSLPIRDVHMMLFRTGDVLLWDAFDSGHMAYLWNWSTGALTYVPSADNIFCAGPVLMTDGSALVAGGHSAGGVGIPDVNRFDPVTRTWSSLAPMAFQRWYPTATTLSDGRVLVVSGATTCFTCTGDIPELYNPATNTWTQLTGAQLSMPLYPHMFVLPDGRVLYASSTEGTIQTQALNVATQTWTIIDPFPFAGEALRCIGPV